MTKLFVVLQCLFKPLIAFAMGILTTFAFAPFHLSFLAVICPAALLWLWQNASNKQAAILGWCFGFGLYVSGTWWVYLSMQNFGHMAPPLAALATVLLAGYLGLFFALMGWLVCKGSVTYSWHRALWLFPAAWVLVEWLRSFLFTGFHWLILGYAMIDTPLAGYAPLLGVYGLSFLTMMTAGILYQALVSPKKSLPLLLLLTAIIWINGWLFQHYQFTHDNGKQLKVALLQGNVAQELKWQPEQTQHIVDLYDGLTAKHWDADLIIWPEAALPMLKEYAEPYLQQLQQTAQQHQRSVLLGVPVKDQNLYYNGLILIGQNQGHYYKRHLVPFGEYTPFGGLLDPLMKAMQIPMSSFSSGKIDQPPLHVKDVHLAPFICYEIVEPDEVRRGLQHAEIIVSVSDDSWFDGSIASEQHLQMARMRSLENGMPQLFLSSRGASAIISAQGKIMDYLPEHKIGVIQQTVRTIAGITPWRYLGSMPILTFCLLAFLWKFPLFTAKIKKQH